MNNQIDKFVSDCETWRPLRMDLVSLLYELAKANQSVENRVSELESRLDRLEHTPDPRSQI